MLKVLRQLSKLKSQLWQSVMQNSSDVKDSDAAIFIIYIRKIIHIRKIKCIDHYNENNYLKKDLKCRHVKMADLKGV